MPHSFRLLLFFCLAHVRTRSADRIADSSRQDRLMSVEHKAFHSHTASDSSLAPAKHCSQAAAEHIVRPAAGLAGLSD